MWFIVKTSAIQEGYGGYCGLKMEKTKLELDVELEAPKGKL
jgi:hypothetical protein